MGLAQRREGMYGNSAAEGRNIWEYRSGGKEYMGIAQRSEGIYGNSAAEGRNI